MSCVKQVGPLVILRIATVAIALPFVLALAADNVKMLGAALHPDTALGAGVWLSSLLIMALAIVAIVINLPLAVRREKGKFSAETLATLLLSALALVSSVGVLVYAIGSS